MGYQFCHKHFVRVFHVPGKLRLTWAKLIQSKGILPLHTQRLQGLLSLHTQRLHSIVEKCNALTRQREFLEIKDTHRPEGVQRNLGVPYDGRPTAELWGGACPSLAREVLRTLHLSPRRASPGPEAVPSASLYRYMGISHTRPPPLPLQGPNLGSGNGLS